MTAEPVRRAFTIVVFVVVVGRWAPSSLAGPFLDQPERSSRIPCQKGDSSNDLWAWDAPALFPGSALGPDDP